MRLLENITQCWKRTEQSLPLLLERRALVIYLTMHISMKVEFEKSRRVEESNDGKGLPVHHPLHLPSSRDRRAT